jgi:isopenicillin-N epimerase
VIAGLTSGFATGDELLTTDHRYGAVATQFSRSGTDHGTTAVVAHVPLDVTTAAEMVDAITSRITARTRLLVIDAVASLSGFVFPVAEIVAAAHDRGVPVLVDAAHAPGQIEVDLRTIGADFWVGNLHKWVCCPRALAVLYVDKRWQNRTRPLVASHHFDQGFQPAFDWTGTFDPVNLLAVPIALDFWDRIGGWDEVRRRQRALVDDGASVVAKALGTQVPIRDEFRAAMRIVELPEPLSPERRKAVEAALSQDHRIEVSLMHLHERTFVRVCGQIYNTPSDYARLAAALPELVEAE